jgi:hypothetical protein
VSPSKIGSLKTISYQLFGSLLFSPSKLSVYPQVPHCDCPSPLRSSLLCQCLTGVWLASVVSCYLAPPSFLTDNSVLVSILGNQILRWIQWHRTVCSVPLHFWLHNKYNIATKKPWICLSYSCISFFQVRKHVNHRNLWTTALRPWHGKKARACFLSITGSLVQCRPSPSSVSDALHATWPMPSSQAHQWWIFLCSSQTKDISFHLN